MDVKATKGRESFLDAYINEHRRNILDLCSDNPKSIAEIERALDIGHGTALYHVGYLEKLGLVSKEPKGRATMIKTIQQGMKSKINKDEKKFLKDNKTLIKDVLQYLLDKKKEKYAVIRWGLFVKFGKGDQYWKIIKVLSFLEMNGYMGNTITEDGELFLKNYT